MRSVTCRSRARYRCLISERGHFFYKGERLNIQPLLDNDLCDTQDDKGRSHIIYKLVLLFCTNRLTNLCQYAKIYHVDTMILC